MLVTIVFVDCVGVFELVFSHVFRKNGGRLL